MFYKQTHTICYKCESRYLGCHSECKDYLKEIENNIKRREIIQKNKKEYKEMDCYVQDKVSKSRKKLKQKNKYKY